MANLIEWITNNIPESEIDGVVIGEMGWGDYASSHVPKYNEQPRGKVLSWIDAKPLLDYEFSSGYGAPQCNAVYVWGKSTIMGICQYDGSTAPFFIPRNPIDIIPEMPGG